MTASNPTPTSGVGAGQPQQGHAGRQDEPEITQEEDIPLDGKDPVGEQMMEGLGRDRAEQQQQQGQDQRGAGGASSSDSAGGGSGNAGNANSSSTASRGKA